MTAAGRLADPLEVRAHLVAAAKAGESITYSELLNRLGHEFSRPKMRALCKTLGSVDEQAVELGEPELAVLVVRQSDGLPGQGWWVSGGAAGHDYSGPWEGPEARRLVAGLHARAFDYWRRPS
ncbi:MAG TPA: ribose-phosphate pyrophosphokinase [Sphingomicrobium sp.]|nr:ribose-phosphate pyrophosphokinase [Sphingomicrobium sp.]